MKSDRARFFLYALLLAEPLAAQETITLPTMVVTATRTSQAIDTLPVTVDIFTADDLLDSPAATIDDTLRQSAAFSLFRRTDSLTANPTTQGVSLRGLGPSGASRSIVLLDGVPLNDPFGGWVAWAKLPKLSIDHAEIVRGGGSITWGNTALGGAVQLFTDRPTANQNELEATIGDHGTLDAEAVATHASFTGKSAVRVDAAAFHTDGTDLIKNQGPIDRTADLDTQRTQATFLSALNPTTTLIVDTRAFAEDRGNGTPLQRNTSHEAFLSAKLLGTPNTDPNGVSAWSAVLYGQTQSFSSFFTSINAGRTTETPANNQYDVPSTAVGGAFTATWNHNSDANTTTGIDARWVTGETREDYTWSIPLNQFTKRRYAGGDQTFFGAFATHERILASDWRGSLGARLDYWQNTNGHRHEFTPATGTITRDDHYANKDGFAFSPNAGLVWRVAPDIRARASVYEAFRVPTLNEYCRPFRVDAVTTDANQNLKPEKLTGGELGMDFGNPHAGLSLTAFANDIRDAVTNVTLTPTTRQRQNLDLVRVLGLEAGAHWQILPTLRLKVDTLLSDARVIDGGGIASSLDGKRLAQVPRQTFTADLHWSAPCKVEVTTNLRWVSTQYDDDANTLRLASATTIDLGVSRRFAHGWEVFAAIDNLFDSCIETGLPSPGIVSVAPPRTIHGGVRWMW